MTKLAEEWGWPGNARKAHWFPAGDPVSVCRRWMYAGPRQPDTHQSPDDCVTCRRIVDQHKEATP